MCLLSIIIPIYKVEKYLHKCVDSIIEACNGHEHECEIILINDGCPNNSGIICDDYSSKYSFIKTIHKENGGVSDARNAGIKQAKGKYLCFIDSDDYVNENLAKVFTILNNNADCDVFKFPYIEEPTKKIKSKNSKSLNVVQYINDNNIKNIINIASYKNSACIRIAKKELVTNTNNYFVKNRVAEDYHWSLRALIHAKTIYISDIAYYHYMTAREGSIMNTYKLKNYEDAIYLSNQLVKELTSLNLSNKKFKEYYKVVSYVTINNIVHINQLTKQDKKQAIQIYKSNKHLLKYAAPLPHKLVSLVLKTIGINLTLKLLAIVKIK